MGAAGPEAKPLFAPDLSSPGARSATRLARLALHFHPSGRARSLPLSLAGITTASRIKPENRVLYCNHDPASLCSLFPAKL